MGAPSEDLTGRVFTRLRVLGPQTGNRGRPAWLCICDPVLGGCGSERVIASSDLVNGKRKSCGCLRLEFLAEGRPKKILERAEYRSWRGMKNRCYSTSASSYPHYGGRGITVCERWIKSFDDFLSDMGPKPSPKHSIDRINNDGNYEPGNCRWATQSQQMRNSRVTRMVTFNGETRSAAEWGEITGVKRNAIVDRIDCGLDVKTALTASSYGMRNLHTYEYEGESKTINQWAESLGMNNHLIRNRIARGWPMRDVLTPRVVGGRTPSPIRRMKRAALNPPDLVNPPHLPTVPPPK